MGFDWEQTLGTGGTGIVNAYEERIADVLYQDHPTAAPSDWPVDPGDDVLVLPFHEV